MSASSAAELVGPAYSRRGGGAVITKYWRELLDARADEAVAALLALDCVEDVVVGGSLGRGDPWPLSDIDLIGIVRGDVQGALETIVPVRDELIGWWASSGRAQSLDIGWICFTATEAQSVVDAGSDGLLAALAEARWLHGTDKLAGGHGALSDGVGSDLAALATETRFWPEVREVRREFWMARATTAINDAQEALAAGDDVRAAERAAAIGSLAVALLESWGEREGGMARFATRFERIAAARGHADLALVAGSSPGEVCERATDLPPLLQLRVELAFEARSTIGEAVTWDQNLRDQVLAFQTLAPRRKSVQVGSWAQRRIPFDGREMLTRATEAHTAVERLVARADG